MYIYIYIYIYILEFDLSLYRDSVWWKTQIRLQTSLVDMIRKFRLSVVKVSKVAKQHRWYDQEDSTTAELEAQLKSTKAKHKSWQSQLKSTKTAISRQSQLKLTKTGGVVKAAKVDKDSWSRQRQLKSTKTPRSRQSQLKLTKKRVGLEPQQQKQGKARKSKEK